MIKIFCVGFHIEGVKAFQYLAENYSIVGFMTLNIEESNKRSGVFSYESFCEKYKLPYYEVNHINDQSSISTLRKAEPDILVVLGWSQLLNDEVLSIPSIGTIGAHASLLPKMRGSAPINWAIIKGKNVTGNTIMWLNTGVDTGKIIDQYEFDISLYDSCKTLYDKVAESNKVMLERSLPIIQNQGKIGVEQSNHEDNILPRRKPKDGLINFDKESIEIYNFVRALTRPYPGAFFYYNNVMVKVWRVSLCKSYVSNSKPGAVLDFIYGFTDEDCAVLISTKMGAIIIKEIEVEGTIIKGKELHGFFKINDKL